MAVKSRSSIEARIRKLEASMQEAKRKEEQARRLLDEHLNDESASAHSGDIVAIQANIRALDEAIANGKSELKNVSDYENSKEGKADHSRLEDLLKVHEKLFEDVKAKARDLFATCEKLDASLSEYDRIASRMHSQVDAVSGYVSIRMSKRYAWVRRIHEAISQWLGDEGWLNFKL